MTDYQYKYYRRDKDCSGLSRKVIIESSFFKGQNQLTEIIYRYNGNITGYEESVSDLFSYSITHIIRIGRQTTLSLEKIIRLKEQYSLASIQRALKNTRAVGNFVVNGTAYYKQENKYYPVTFIPSTQTLSIMTRCASKNASNALVEKDLQILTNLADRLWRDLNDIGDIDLDALERKVMLRKSSKSRSRAGSGILGFLAKLGAKVGIAMLAGAVGGKIDLPDDIFDLDFETDSDCNFDTGYDSDNSDSLQDTDYSNVSFGSNKPPHASSDGYIFQGGEKYNGFEVYKKQGHKYYWDSINDVFVKIS